MHNDTTKSGPAASNDHASPRTARVITAAVIALAIGSVALVVQPGANRSERVDYAAASVANLASSAPADVTVADTGSAPRFQRSDEPAYTDSMNPHWG